MSRYTLRRTRLGDGEETTTYVVRHRLAGLSVGVHVFRQARRLDHWCHKHDVREAVVGGFYLRDPFRPLGDVWCAGEHVAGTPFVGAYRDLRPALDATDGRLEIAPRGALPERPEGDLLQAGPLLVADGEIAFDGSDREGFTAGAAQFDSDITDGRHPRAAVGIAEKHLVVLVCDGRRSRTRRRAVDARARRHDARARLPRGDEPGRRRLGHARPPRSPAQPPLQRAGPGGAGLAADRQRAPVQLTGSASATRTRLRSSSAITGP